MSEPSQNAAQLDTPHTIPPGDPSHGYSAPEVPQSSATVPEAPPGEENLPRKFGRYLLRHCLGKGGMGTVYLAHDTHLDLDVAVKIPHPAFQTHPEARERFFREARSTARLQHPGICRVYDVNEVEGTYYLSMAYVEGQSLAALVPSFATRPQQEAVGLVHKLALALEHAHGHGIIHRDLKPLNIMIDRRGQPIIMDFGLARQISAGTRGQTLEGVVMGTPEYMSPEQARGEVTAIGPGCDIYSLGVILYELLTGRTPFQGPTLDVLAQQLRDEPPPPKTLRPEIDCPLQGICLKAMAKQPSHRFLSMREFADALEAYLRGESVAGTCVGGGPEPLNPELVTLALVLLRTWGWQANEHLREQLRPECVDPEGRGTLFLDWITGSTEAHERAIQEFKQARQFRALHGWACFAQAMQCRERHEYARMVRLLDDAVAQGDPSDSVLKASVAHQRGEYLYYAGKHAEALRTLHEALDLLGREHSATGWVLLTLGRVYAAKNNFHAAQEFYEQAVACLRRFTTVGLNEAHLRLGQLHLDWDDLERAESYYENALRICHRENEGRGQARALHQLGLVAVARAQADPANSREQQTEARQLLDEALRRFLALGDRVRAGLVHKDRANLALLEGNLAEAEQHLSQAEELLGENEGETWRGRGVLLRALGRHEESGRMLQKALAHYDRRAAHGDAARTQLEIARTLLASGAVPRLTLRAFQEALERAELCRRPGLVRAAEEELKAFDPQAYWRRVCDRSRGRGAPRDTSSVITGESEEATALFLNLEEFVPFCQGMDPGSVLLTLNQLMADLSEALRRQDAHVTAYLGGGFMALVRRSRHAERAVNAALDLLEVLKEFNRPRAVLGLRLLKARIGIASGGVWLGNIGTYEKMDFTAIGMPVNLASRLMRQATSSSPCISQETYFQVRDRFVFRSETPRVLDLRGIGRREVWDVVGRKS